MTSTLSSLSRLIALVVLTLLWIGTAVAQVQNQQSSPDRPAVRQPSLSSAQQQESLQANADKTSSEADKKMREMDRRLSRTLRSVCSGC